MAYGLRIINDDSELLIDSDYVNPTFVQKLEFNATPTFTEAGVAGSGGFVNLHTDYIRRDYSTSAASLNTGTYIVLWRLPDNGNIDVWYNFPTSTMETSGSLTCQVYANSTGAALSYTLPTAYIFATNASALATLYTEGSALRMYNSSNQKTFDSTFTQLVPYDIKDSFTVPGAGENPASILLNTPSSPVYLLPRVSVLFSVDAYNESNKVDQVVFDTMFRRLSSAIYAKTLSSYATRVVGNNASTYGNPNLIFAAGNLSSLSVLVADADLYQAASPSTGGGANPTYTLSSNYSTVNEGVTFVITLTTTLITNGTAFPFTVTGISAADLSSGSLNGNFIVQNNTATANFTVSNDVSLEGTETFTLSLQGINSSVSVSILDTSKPVAAYNFGAASSINEGSTGSIQFNYSNSAGVSFGFSATSPSSGEQNDGSGDVTVNTTDFTVGSTDAAGTVSVSYSVAADLQTEGPEYFRIQAYVNGAYYTSDNILISDTSTTPPPGYSIVAVSPPWNENTTQSTTVSLTNVLGRTYYPTSDNASVTCQTSSFYVNSNSFSTTLYWDVGAITSDTTVNLYLRRNSLTGPIDAEVSVTVKNILAAGTPIGSPFCVSYGSAPYTLRQVRADGSGGTYNDDTNNSVTCGYTPPATYSLARSIASVNEGGSFSISFSTNQAGSFGYTISGVSSADLSGASLTGTISNGSVLSYNVAADATTENTEIFTISLNNGQASSSVTIGDTSQYPAAGTLVSAFCLTYSSPYTYRQVYNNGSGGTYNVDTNNSTTCGYVAPTPYGTYLSQYCSGFSLYYRYADGNYGYYDVLQANNSPSCGYVAPSYSLGQTFTSLNNGAATSFYLQVTNPPAGDNVYVSVSGAGAARASVSPAFFTTNTGTTIYYIQVTNTTPTSTIASQSVTITVSYNNGATPISFSYSIPEYNVAATAPTVTSVVIQQATYYSGENVDAVINFSGTITADTYINIRIDAGGFGTLYYPSISGAAQSYTTGAYGDYIVMSIGTTAAYYAGPVNPGGFSPPQTGCRLYAKAVTAGGTQRQAYVQSSAFTLDGGMAP